MGVILSERLHFDDHILAVLKVCSQRMHLPKLSRDHSLPLVQLNIIIHVEEKT